MLICPICNEATVPEEGDICFDCETDLYDQIWNDDIVDKIIYNNTWG